MWHGDVAQGMCAIIACMPDDLDRLKAAARAWRRKRAEMVELIVKASDAGVPQKEIVAATGFTREHIRRLVKQAHEEAGVRASDKEEAAARVSDEVANLELGGEG